MIFDSETEIRIQTLANFTDAYIDAIRANGGKNTYFFEKAISRAFQLVDLSDRARLERSQRGEAEYKPLIEKEVRAIVNRELSAGSQDFWGDQYRMNTIYGGTRKETGYEILVRHK